MAHKGKKETIVSETLIGSDKLLGMAVQVKAHEFTFQLRRDQSASKDLPKFRGCSVGDYVVVDSQKLYFVGRVEEVKLSYDATQSEGGPAALAKVQLIAEIDLKEGAVYFSFSSTPRVGDGVYLAPGELIEVVIESQQDDAARTKIHLGALSSGSRSPFWASPETLFGRHLAVVGATGAGKSWSVARLIEECARFNSRVIIFDATGEYHRITEGIRHVHLGTGPGDDNQRSTEVSLPYHCLTEGDLFAIFKPSGESQAPKLRAAIKSLKLARLSPGLAPGGTILKAYRSKTEYERSYQHYLAEIEGPYAEFEIRHLTKQIENECVAPQSSPTEPRVWGGPDGIDMGNCVPLITRINDIIHSPSLTPIFNSASTPSLLDVLADFFEDRSSRIMCISLKHLSFAFHAREIVANAIGRRILSWGRKGNFVSLPVVVVLDEAHQFLNETLIDDDSPYPLNSFSLIAKEGRKYAVNLCIATQRPRDIPEAILSQMGTFIIHRLVSDLDRRIIERASTDANLSALAIVPTLGPGEALFLGADFNFPVFIKVAAPVEKPDSRGPDYQKHWTTTKRGAEAEDEDDNDMGSEIN